MSDPAPAVDWSFSERVTVNEPPPARSASPGARIGDYVVVGALGKGGMGVVLEVADETGRRLALKMLTGQASAHAVERFRREGEVTAGVRHPNVVSIHDGGVHEGKPYLVYELVGGRDFAELWDELSPEARIDVVLQAAHGLGHAHGLGIVHRDVKPSNVLVDGEGHAKVADFGLAYVAELERLTRTGTMVGTPYTMSPEQVGGHREQYGPATDVWALGVMLYRALSGRYPFEAETLQQLVSQILQKEPEDLPDVSAGLSAVCFKALSKPAGERYPDAEAFAADLSRALRGEPVEARPRRRRRAASLAYALLAAFAVGGLVLWASAARTARRLEAHAAWEAASLEPAAFGLLNTGLTVEELDRRRGALAGETGAAVAAHLDLLDATLRAFKASGEGFDPVPPLSATRSAAQLTADGVILRAQGEAAAARARAEAALRLSEDARGARALLLLLDADADPGGLVRAAARGRRLAKELLTAQWQGLMAVACARAATEDAGVEQVGLLADAAPPAEAGPAIRAGLETGAAPWKAALEAGFADGRELVVLDRLAAVLGERARGGPKLGAALSVALERLAAGLSDPNLGGDGSRNLGRFVVVESRLFYRVDGIRQPPGFVDLLRTAVSALVGRATDEQKLRGALSAARCAEDAQLGDWATEAADQGGLDRWRETCPQSKAGHYLRAIRWSVPKRVNARRGWSPKMLRGAREEYREALERCFAATLDDLLPAYRLDAALRLAGERVSILSRDGARAQGEDPVLTRALSEVRRLGYGGKLATVRRAHEIECQAVLLLRGEEAAAAAWSAALVEVDRWIKEEPAHRDDQPLRERSFLRISAARAVHASGDAEGAWRLLEEAFEGLTRGPLGAWSMGHTEAARSVLRFALAEPAFAEAALRLVEPRLPASVTHRQGAGVIVDAARLLRRVGRAEDAQALLSEGLEQFPENDRLRTLVD